MKKLMSSMLAIAAMASMISCSTEDILDEKTPGTDNNGLVPIKMTAEIGDLTTKAAIGQDPITGKLTEPLNVFFLRSDGPSADWTTLTPLNATIDIEGAITFTDGKQYYEKDGSTAHLFGYYPVAKTDNKKLEWTITGKEDIIISNVQSGSKTSTQELVFGFEHKLTQLQFNVKVPDGITTDEKLTSITVKNLKTNAQYDPTAAAADAFTFTETTDNLKTEGAVTDTPISTTAISGGTLLVEASTVAKDFSIDVVTTDASNKTKTYTGTVSIDATANTSYKVNLTISQKEVTGTATISPWINNNTPIDKDII